MHRAFQLRQAAIAPTSKLEDHSTKKTRKHRKLYGRWDKRKQRKETEERETKGKQKRSVRIEKVSETVTISGREECVELWRRNMLAQLQMMLGQIAKRCSGKLKY